MGEANQRGPFETRRMDALAKERELAELRRRMALFAAVVRREGRVRVTKREIDAIGVSYGMRIARDGDTFTVSWEEPR